MSAGHRNRRIAFEERVEEPDPADPLVSGEGRIWTERFARWAAMKPERMTEAGQGGALIASGSWTCEVPHDPETAAVAPEEWRIRLDGALYNVRGAEDPDGCRRIILMRLEKSVAT